MVKEIIYRIGQRVKYTRMKDGALAQRDRSSVDGIAVGNIKNQHRGYLESGPPLQYIFEEGKLLGQFPDGLTAQQYIRKQFLEMYKNNTGYFTSSTSSKTYWETLGVSFNIPGKTDSEILSIWLSSKTESSTFLNFIIVK
jgi:hypothetical protein